MSRTDGGEELTVTPRRGRVVEYSRSVAPAYAGKLLREIGFLVARGPAPLATEALQIYLGAGKMEVDDEAARRLAESADIVVTDDPEPFERCPGLVVSITPFGRTGPYAGWHASELVVEAMGGLLYLVGDPDREPVMPHGYQMSYFAGASATLAAVAAFYRGGTRGERIDVSLIETVAGLIEGSAQLVEYRGRVRRRFGSQVLGAGPCTDIYATTDGYVSLAAQFPPQWKALCGAIGRPELADDPRLSTYALQARHPELLAPILRQWFAARSTADAFETLQLWRIPAGPAFTPADLVENPQLGATDAWARVEGTPYRVLNCPFRPVGEPAETAVPSPRRASEDDLARWVEAAAPVEQGAPSSGGAAGPLAGIRIIDLTAVYAGPFASRVLADLGAEVIKVEAGVRPDILRLVVPHLYGSGEVWNRGGFFHEHNRNKLGVTLDLRTPEGRALLLGLVRESDAVIENYSLRVMPNLGLSFEELTKVNPRLVMVSMPGFGTTGPYKDYVAFGEMIEAMAGLSSLTGYRDGPPLRIAIAYPDPVAGIHAALSLVLGLMRRDETGAATHFSLSHLHAMSRFIGEELLAQQQGRTPPRRGNRHEAFVPQGVFPCEGQDRWIAISVTSDAEWAALADVLDDEGLRADPRFEDAAGRRANEDEVEARLAASTRTWDDSELAHRLQARGVAAGVVADGPRVLADAHLRARRFFRNVRHPDAGDTTIPGPLWHFEPELEICRPAPRLGEHTDEVLKRILGLDDGELRRLRATGITSNEGALGSSMRDA